MPRAPWLCLAAALGVPSLARAACDPSGDAVLNEVVSDPDGTDGDAEWVELFNRGATPISLEDWRVERATTPGAWATQFLIPAGASLDPGEFLVVGGPAAAVPGDALLVDQQVDMGNASSNSDGVRLVRCDGVVADTVIYGNTNAEGQLFLDDEGSEVLEARLAPVATRGKSIGRVPDGVDTEDGATDFVVLSPATPGVSNGTTGGGGGPTCAGAGTPGTVYLNELFANPGAATNPDGSGDTGYEWVELYNAGAAAVDLSGWEIDQASTPSNFEPDGRRTKVTFPAGTVLEPGAHLLVAEYLVELPAGVDAYVIPDEGTLSLGNSQDALRLVDCTGQELDRVVYGGANPDGFAGAPGGPVLDDAQVAPPIREDQSLARRADGHDTDDDGKDWVSGEATPGETNPDLRCKGTAGDVVINELLANPAGSDGEVQREWVELFNRGDAPVDLSTWTVEKAGSVGTDGELNRTLLLQVEPGTVLLPGEFLVVGALLADEAQQFVEGFDLLSGSGGDLVLLYDCEGTRADGVLYGGDNDDGLPEDDGTTPERGAKKPSDDQCVMRLVDGVDTDRSEADFVTASYCTPGATNEREGGGGGGSSATPSGCGGGPGNGQPRQVQARSVAPGGCDTAPVPRLAPLALLLGLSLRRRRRATRTG